jgi:hypothetical protein
MVPRKRQRSGRAQSPAARLVTERTAELVAAGMENSRALEQARAELAKGILAAGCCHLEEVSEESDWEA